MTSGITHVPTDEIRAKVGALKAFGRTNEEIARYFKIDDKTLTKYYAYELDCALTEMVRNVAGCLYDKCLDGDTSAMMFFLKTRARWREKDPEEQINNQSLVEKLIDKLVDH